MGVPVDLARWMSVELKGCGVPGPAPDSTLIMRGPNISVLGFTVSFHVQKFHRLNRQSFDVARMCRNPASQPALKWPGQRPGLLLASIPRWLASGHDFA